MSEPIVFISHHRVKEGKIDGFKQYSQQVVRGLEADKPGTVVFLGYLNADATEVTFIHAFPDADAMDLHMQGAADRSRGAYEFIEPASFEIYGRPNEGVLEMMKQISGSEIAVTIQSQYIVGFTRLRSG